MFMLSTTVISLPFSFCYSFCKGWELIIKNLVASLLDWISGELDNGCFSQVATEGLWLVVILSLLPLLAS